MTRKNPIRGLGSAHFISASVSGLFALFACSVSAQNPLPTPGIPTEAEAERVIVTGSNIPTAQEVGPNPVDTYRPEDIEKLGARNATDLLTKLPQEMGSTINQNANDARELETWMIAGTGDDKTDIVIIADAYDRAAIYGRDRTITSNANQAAWGGFDLRSSDFPGVIGPFGKPAAPLGFRLIPKLFFSGNSPP